jgi:hypothetical protein
MLVQGMNRLVTLLPLHFVTTEAKMQFGKLFVVFTWQQKKRRLFIVLVM